MLDFFYTKLHNNTRKVMDAVHIEGLAAPIFDNFTF
jgi:hypothetical protein